MTILDSAMNKASIVSVVGQYVSLRKTGGEYKGLCPFHLEKTPSFAVNDDKGVFYCFGCGAKGDVYDFTMQFEGIGFREAKARLGVTDEYRPKPLTLRQREASEVAAAWMAEQRHKINALLAEVLEKIDVADEIGDSELAESFLREQSLLCDLYEDLDISRYATDLLSIRATIEAITEGIEPAQIHFEFPPLTPEYGAHLEAVVGGVAL